MFTRSALVLALVALVVLVPASDRISDSIALAAPLAVVFPLMAVAVGMMGVERMLLSLNTVQAVARADHEKVGRFADHPGSSPRAALTLAIRRNCVSH